jgi:tRNA(Ile)-lysidine synthase
MKLCRSFTERLSEGLIRLNPGGRAILLAVSGGADSMAMLHGTLAIASQIGLTRIEVAHLNHGLRGAESHADAALVAEACRTAGIEFVVEAIKAASLKEESRGSLEEAARSARYRFLTRIAHERALPLIATAHHQQDHVETILFSLLRGTGLRGLQGIPAARLDAQGVQIIRPMLLIDRAAIRQYISDHEIAYRDDASNDTPDFARNRIRMLLKALPSEHTRQLTSHLLDLSDQAYHTMAAMDNVASNILNRCLLTATSCHIAFNREGLQQWPEPLVRHALITQWIRQKWPRRSMNREQWLRLSTAATISVPRRWSFPGGVQMTIRRAVLHLELIPPERPTARNSPESE